MGEAGGSEGGRGEGGGGGAEGAWSTAGGCAGFCHCCCRAGRRWLAVGDGGSASNAARLLSFASSPWEQQDSVLRLFAAPGRDYGLHGKHWTGRLPSQQQPRGPTDSSTWSVLSTFFAFALLTLLQVTSISSSASAHLSQDETLGHSDLQLDSSPLILSPSSSYCKPRPHGRRVCGR